MTMGSNKLTIISPQQVTLAFHFRYIMRGEILDSTAVAVLLLERVLRVIEPDLKKTGSVAIRMGHLIYLRDLRERGAALERTLFECYYRCMHVGRARHTEDGPVPLDRIFFVTLSGHLGGFQKHWSRRLRRHVSHPFLFSLDVDRDDSTLEWTYLKQNLAVGEFGSDRYMSLEFDSINFEDDLSKMLERLGFPKSYLDGSSYDPLSD